MLQIAVQTERVSHVNLQLQTESQKSLSKAREVEALQKAIAERTEQIAKAEQALEESKQRFANQEKLVNEVILFESTPLLLEIYYRNDLLTMRAERSFNSSPKSTSRCLQLLYSDRSFFTRRSWPNDKRKLHVQQLLLNPHRVAISMSCRQTPQHSMAVVALHLQATALATLLCHNLHQQFNVRLLVVCNH